MINPKHKRHFHDGLPCRMPWRCEAAGGNKNCTCVSDYGARWNANGNCPIHGRGFKIKSAASEAKQ